MAVGLTLPSSAAIAGSRIIIAAIALPFFWTKKRSKGKI